MLIPEGARRHLPRQLSMPTRRNWRSARHFLPAQVSLPMSHRCPRRLRAGTETAMIRSAPHLRDDVPPRKSPAIHRADARSRGRGEETEESSPANQKQQTAGSPSIIAYHTRPRSPHADGRVPRARQWRTFHHHRDQRRRADEKKSSSARSRSPRTSAPTASTSSRGR